MEELPRENRRLSSSKPFLGPGEASLGLHLQMDQRLLHCPDRSRLLPQVRSRAADMFPVLPRMMDGSHLHDVNKVILEQDAQVNKGIEL